MSYPECCPVRRMMQYGLAQKGAGLPLAPNPEHASRLYDGTEYKDSWIGKEKTCLDELEHTLVCELLPKTGHRIIDFRLDTNESF